MIPITFLRLAALVSACAGMVGSAMASTLQLHEAHKGVPAGFSLHGAASPDTMLNLRMALVQCDFPGLEERLYDVSTPSSANYGKHLSKAEVERYVAPKPESVTAVNAWLADNGLSGTPISAAGDWIAVQVPVSTANKLLGAQFSVFSDDTTGRQVIRTLSYSIPAELKSHLDLVHPTITFSDIQPLLPVVSPLLQANPQAENVAANPNAVPASCNSLVNNKTAIVITPACLQALYGIPATPATQSSNTLGVSGFLGQFANNADLQLFLTTFRPDVSSDTAFKTQTLDDGQNSQDPAVAGVEANLDIQYTVGIATGLPTTFISVGDDNKDGLFGFLDIINYLLGQDAPPQVLTTSYGANEGPISPMLVQNLCNAYAQLGARGTSILFASGDGGVAGSQGGTICSDFVPTFPSGCPFLTSVGATSLPDSGIETAASFSSGGFSDVFPTPPYQKAAVDAYIAGIQGRADNLTYRFNQSGRAYPDVSAQGVSFAIVVNGAFNLVSGTSASSPTFASVIALINDHRIAAGKPALGFLNPFLYSSAGASALNDVTTGTNPGCNSDGFPATEGWDPVTGLGTPDFAKLLAAALALP